MPHETTRNLILRQLTNEKHLMEKFDPMETEIHDFHESLV